MLLADRLRLLLLWALLWALPGACHDLALPDCSLGCIMAALAQPGCDPAANISCICPRPDLYRLIEPCLETRCTFRESLDVRRIETTACDRPRRSRKTQLLLPIAVVAVAFVMIHVRMLSRRVVSGHLETDDFVMIACGITFIAMEIVNQIQGAVAFGVDLWTVAPDDITLGLKLLYVVESLYIVTLTLAKVSVLLFYLRTFPQNNVRILTYSTLIFIILVNCILLGVQIFQCVPVEANWEIWNGTYTGSYFCIDVNRFVVAGAGLNIIQELMIMFVPIPALLQLSMSVRSRVSALVMFSLGTVTVFISGVRMAYIAPVANSVNISWDYTDAVIWTGIEAAATVMIPCLPALRALITRPFMPRNESLSSILSTELGSSTDRQEGTELQDMGTRTETPGVRGQG